MTLTKQQLQFLHELAQLDRIGLGMLAPSGRWSATRAQRVKAQLVARGYVRAVPAENPCGEVLELRTRGYRALLRTRRAYQPHLPLAPSIELHQ